MPPSPSSPVRLRSGGVRLVLQLAGVLLAAGGAGVGAVVAGLVGYTWWIKRQAERTVPPAGRFLELDGGRIHYVDEGSGPAIVLIHGLGAQLLNFLPESLGPLRRDYRVIALDRPGSGYSTRASGRPATLAAQAETVAAFITALGLRRPLLAGHSFGGAVAIRVALDHPGLVGGLALLAPLTHPYEAMPKMFERVVIRSPLARFLVSWTLVTPTAMRHRDHVAAAMFAPDAPSPAYAVEGGGVLNLRPSSFYATSSDLAALEVGDMAGMAARYGELDVPVGILFGTGDPILDHRLNGVAMQGRVPELELELFDGGHMIPVAAPERSVAFIRRMAGRVGGIG